ncbi:unnamed protein product [Spirodela intermedia]|uniref:Pectinesterase inhibitor domain-containing protein n=1 Tax=Spirodela intermedia TaxID=51605 RepID=A0A7I8LGU9_SPIIN|nr:unnamed protein product [Spirodela intermedia]
MGGAVGWPSNLSGIQDDGPFPAYWAFRSWGNSSGGESLLPIIFARVIDGWGWANSGCSRRTCVGEEASSDDQAPPQKPNTCPCSVAGNLPHHHRCPESSSHRWVPPRGFLLSSWPSWPARHHLHLPRANHRHHGAGGAARLCSRTDYPTLCMAVGKRLGGSVPSADALVRATIQVAMQKTHEAKATAARLGAAPSRDRYAKGNVETCRRSYDSALADLQTSLRALRSRSLADLRINLSAVITDVGTCDDGFMESAAGRRSPFAGVNGAIHKFASNGLALSETMRGRH